MQEILSQVFTYIWGAWRHRWAALAVAWSLAIAGWTAVWHVPEAYVASSRVYVDTNSVLRPLLVGLAIQPDIDERISMLSATFLSRPNLEELMRMTDLDLEVRTEVEQEDLLQQLGEDIKLAGDLENPSLYSISVRHENRDMARKIAQSLLTIFIENSLGEKRQLSTGAEAFLGEQIAEYEERLIASENRLAKFKQENVDVLSGAGGDYYSNLQATRSELDSVKLTLKELQNRRRELQRQLEGETPAFVTSSVTSADSMTPLDVRIQALRVRLDDLLSVYTDKHPEVRQIRGLIEELESEKAAEYSLLVDDSAAGFGGVSGSPVYQGMRSMLAETEASIAELRVRAQEYERRVADLESKVNDIPAIEAELKQLDRDYTVVLAQHQELMERLESARLSQDVEKTSNDVVFRVIDPPYVPSEPSEPNKLLLNGAVLVVSLAIGAGVALLIFLISPVIIDPRALTSLTGIPLLGTVSMHRQPEERRAATVSLATFSILTLSLLLVYAGVSVVQGITF